MPPSPAFSCLGNGRASAPDPALRLKAGPLEMDLIEGELRYLSVGGSEAVRRIYAAVRDGNWNTIPARRSLPQVVVEDGGFSVSWQNEHVDGAVDFVWESRLTGAADGTLRWEFDGVARQAFAKNRIGFCILHPLPICQGKPCLVEHVSGDLALRTFPEGIAPDQPVRGLHDFRRMRYALDAAWEVELDLEGDAFEMEDQRNWTDASFKTYSTPQRIPLPAQIQAGQRVRQVVTLRLQALNVSGAETGPDNKSTDGAVTLTLPETAALPFPKLGLGLPTHGNPMTPREVGRLRALRLDHLRVDVKPAQENWRTQVTHAAVEAAKLGLPLEAAVHFPGPAGAVETAAEVQALAGPVERWLVLEEGKAVASPALLESVRTVLRGAVGAGTDQDFFPLNNNRPAPGTADFIFCSIRPQAHAFDDATVIENLDGQTHLTTWARQVFSPLPFVASPVTLKRRWHKGPPRPAEELPPMVDVRQLSLLGAGWLLGSLRALAGAGAAAVTWFETTGWRGVMEVEGGAPLPGVFPSVPGAVFPLYHVLRAVADFREGGVHLVESSHPLWVQAVLLESGARRCLIAANVTGQSRIVSLPAGGVLRLLDPDTAAGTAQEPESFVTARGEPLPAGSLLLPPWALVFVEIG